MVMRAPSIRTLARVFEDPKQARRIFKMTATELSDLPAGTARHLECLNPPKSWDVRMHCLNALDAGFHGLESVETSKGEYASYLNTGDCYAETVIYWRGRYRVQSVGDFVEAQERRGVTFP